MGARTINDNLPEHALEAIGAEGLSRLWAEGRPLSGGRGTARTVALGGAPFVIKRERRGGWAGRALPDRYVRRSPFLREWNLGCYLAGRRLAPEPAALEFAGPRLGFAVFALTRAVLPSRSLSELWREGAMDERALRLAGSAVARLHREGVLHGDLNAGNLLFSESPEVFFLDLRHSTRAQTPPGDRARRANLLRLARSLHKLGAVNGWAWPEHPWDALAAGYVEGWGLGEPWLTAFVAAADRGYPLSARFWQGWPGRT